MNFSRSKDTGCGSWCDSGTRLKNFAEDVLMGICLIHEGRIIYANPRLAEMTGRTAEELGAEGILGELLHPDDASSTLEGLDMVLSGAMKSFLFQDRWIRKDGGIVELEGAFTPTIYRGTPAVIGTAVDITERKRLERQRTDFLAMVTHDFKTPLASVLGYTELIASREELDAEIMELAGHIQRSGRKLLGMVEDFLFHTRLESGNLALEFTPVKLGGLLGELKKEFHVQAAGNGQKIEVHEEDGLTAFMLDRRLIERALSNLLQNAVNYSGKGGVITISAGLRLDDDVNLLALSVSDTGPGVAPELRHRLFDKYFRSSSTGVRGAGLGLTIVKSVAQSHGGSVEIESEPGQGSTFVMLLPALAG